MSELPESIAALLKREGTGISWADFTFNPWIGCTKVGPACDWCYAEDLMGTEGSRLKRVGWGPGEPRLRTSPANWAKPLRWQRIAAAANWVLTVFSLSLGDWADNEVDDVWRLDLAEIIRHTPNLRWLLLTKRIPNVAKMLRAMFPEGVPPNAWLGITVVTQEEVNRDLPRAIAVKKALGIKRLFLSMEPLIERVTIPPELLADVDQVIVGGESGKHPRRMPLEWAYDLLRQCRRASTRFHFKQESQADFPKTYDKPATFPPDLQVRELIADVVPA